ncbi:MAG: hypothetical protein A3G18_03210 [Rhodospirillales bacterium RIFCSPLOWO2_12_FULL_58_28]|nr:MAG: hypothetical protein A3H92_03155 [Rhodospirillales bacterium RIFCSPLOWO2_02_FULL_58_16]OHC77286.1 MAG: hypothetical protein A3G18_03210 [Rhodospirillales bacterium RIFCSPLOWO2_12_FULL_58_28]
MRLPADIHARLMRLGGLPDEQINPAETALVLASIERPGMAIDPYLRHLERLSDEVRVYVDAGGGAAGLDQAVEALCQVIARRYGYKGAETSYEDPDNTNLMRVIDRRVGAPVALGIIYIHVARALGWTISGLDFPARFMVRLEDEGRRVILDPFDGGRVVTPKDMRDLSKAVIGNQAELTPNHYRPLGNRGVLLRLQNHIKFRLIRSERPEDALDAIETMLLFAPATPSLWREAGMLNARLDKIKEAVAALEEYLRRNTGDSARYRTSVFLQELRGRLV